MDLTTYDITLFALVFMRMSGCILFNPILGRQNIPNTLKVGLSLLLSLVIMSYSASEVSEISSLIEYMVMLLLEFMVGFVIGFIISLFSMVISFGGEIMDMQMGMSMSKIFDPQSNSSLSLSATQLNILFIFLFFAADGHITLIHLFLTSGELIPFGQAAIPSQVSEAIIDLFCQCIVLAVKLALPIISVEVLIEMGVGILMKAIPQINIFVVNIQAKLLVGIIMFYILFIPMAGFLENIITILFESLKSTMNLMH